MAVKSTEPVSKNRIFFIVGLLAVCVMAVPYLILGTDSVVTYHDQLDGEMIAYILQAKHLFGGMVLPEFLGGASKTSLTPPAPGCVLLFLSGNYFAAYVFLQMAGSLTGYVGMYLLARKITNRGWCGMIAGVLFAYLPFLPVYGLSQYGIALLFWFFLQMKEGKCRRSGTIYAVFYALNSSFVLVGFAVLATLAAGVAWRFLRREKKGLAAMGIAWLSMLAVYIAENAGLFLQVLKADGGAVSHKAEYVLAPDGFWEGLKTAFLQGGQHSVDYHLYILIAAAVVLVFIWLPGAVWDMGVGRSIGAKSLPGGHKAVRLRSLFGTVGILLVFNLVFALAAALWNAGPGIMLRSHLQALGAFQLDRVLWIAPVFWYLILACVLGIAGECCAAGARALPVLFTVLLVPAVGLTGLTVLKESNLKPNLQKLLNDDYAAITYGDYYALGVMDQVQDYLRESTGMEPEQYRVASLGIDPAASLYAGFYALDGYSNNYSLEYKHAFREIIAPELNKSEYLREYFDDWGNRCYLLSSESPAYYTVEKGGFFFRDLDLNMDRFREMGGRYVLSAAYIQNAQEMGLTLLREEPFETQDSYYRIFLYDSMEMRMETDG